jgi:hypothetical protein
MLSIQRSLLGTDAVPLLVRSVAHFLQTAQPLYTQVEEQGQATQERLPR